MELDYKPLYYTQVTVILKVIDELVNLLDGDINIKDLYFIKNDKDEVKIGVSGNVHKRFLAFDGLNGNIELIKTLKDCGKYEKRLHILFKEYNIKYNNKFDGYTEWFKYNNIVESFIEELSEDNIQSRILEESQKKYSKI